MRTRTARLASTFIALITVTGVAAGCSSGTGDTDGRGDDGRPTVVASTSVYADIARRVAGDAATVDAIVSDPTADPHSFEASPADAAKVAGAALVVYNGAGYDAFVDSSLKDRKGVKTVRAVDEFRSVTGIEVQGHEHGDHGHEGHDHSATEHGHDDVSGDTRTTDNEHVWYSLPTAVAVARAVSTRLGELAPDKKTTFEANAESFARDLAPLEKQVADLKAKPPVAYAQTEPVAYHLFSAAGFTDSTPKGFLTAIEGGTDPAAADVDAATRLLRDRKVAFLAVNPQTAGTATDLLRGAATQANLPVVEVTETLPRDTDYVSWMRANVDHTAAAGRSR